MVRHTRSLLEVTSKPMLMSHWPLLAAKKAGKAELGFSCLMMEVDKGESVGNGCPVS